MKTFNYSKLFFTGIGFIPLCNIRLWILLPVIFIQVSLTAQDKTQYLLHEIPQTISLNPAIGYECKNYFELPLISQLQLYYRNSGFSYRQAFLNNQGETGDSIRLNMDGLSDALGSRNHIRVGGKVNILGFGFAAANEWFYSFNISNRSSTRLSFTRDVVDARDGNWDLVNDVPRDIIVNGTGFHFLNFTEFAFGASTEIYRGFRGGIRAKYLMGSTHLQTRRSNIRILTTDSPIELTGISDVMIRGSLPADIEIDADGYISSIQSNINSYSDLPGLLFAGNHGLAVDAGVIYEYSNNLILSASVLDLGFIRWRRNINVIEEEEDFVFRGIDLDNYLTANPESDFLDALGDSIRSNFRLSGSEGAYTAMTPLRLMAGAEFNWTRTINLGAVVETEILSSRIYPSLTLTMIARPWEFLTASASYSIMDRAFDNFGFGLAVGNGPVQFYIVTDNIPFSYVRDTDTGLIWPYSSKTMSIRAGINIISWCRNKDIFDRKMKWMKSCPAYN